MHPVRLASYGLNWNVFIHLKCIQEMSGQWPTWTVQTLVANSTVPIACTTQWTTVQDTAKSATRKLDLQWLASCEPRPGRCSAWPIVTTWPIVSHAHRHGNSTALGKQWLITQAHGALLWCYLSQMTICKNRHCKWRLAQKRSTKGPKKHPLPTTSRHSQMHKEMQPIKCHIILW